MAILSGINTKLRGSAGNWTFSRLNGQTVAKEKIERKETPTRTMAQMLRRMRWANIVAIWQSFNGDDKPSFQDKDQKHSDFNLFMSANLPQTGVFLEKDAVAMGGAVVAPYQVTRGSLRSIGYSIDGTSNIAVTDLNMGGITIGASTTVGTFSEAIIENNKSQQWRNGDQLSIFVLRQEVDATTNTPRVVTDTFEITLDTDNDSDLLGDILDANTLSVSDGKLALGNAVNGGVAFIHSRKTVSGTIVSTQFIAVSNTILAQYQTQGAFDKAALSYGGINQEDFLTPNVEDDYAFGG